MRRHPLAALLLLALAVAAAALLLQKLRTGGGLAPPPSKARPLREFTGTVEAGGRPVAGARVELFEEAPRGFRREVVADADGAFRVGWTPTATRDPRRLFLAAEDPRGGRGRAVRPAAGGIAIELPGTVAVRGRVVDLAGGAVPLARVHACVQHDHRVVDAVTDEAGEFALAPLPAGAPLHVLVVRAGHRTHLESRFSTADFLTLRLERGLAVAVESRDPSGNAVADVSVRLVVPEALAELAPPGVPEAPGRVVLPDASRGGACLVRVEAPGHLPVELPAAPGRTTPVVLWPARPVLLRAWDLRTREAVDDLSFEVAIHPSGGGAGWSVDNVEHVSRPHAVRYCERAGEHLVRLPACPVRLSCAAPGYEPAEVDVAAAAAEASVRLVPVRDGNGAALLLRAGPAGADLPLAVADETGAWSRAFVLAGGEAEVAVPSGRTLQVASLVAAEGLWVPKMEVPPLSRGERRVVRVGLRPALRLEVRVDPPAEGEATLVDVAHEEVAPERTVALDDGVARFWVRPMRLVRVRIRPRGNWFERDAEIAVEQEDLPWTIALEPAAGASFAVRDRAGHPVPFAAARVWEPDGQGRVDLRLSPRAFRADAAGVLVLQGLREGNAALEVRAPAFRTLRLAAVRLEGGRLLDRGGLELEPAGAVRGRVVDPEGRPVAGAWVHVAEPEVARLQAGDVELDAYLVEGGGHAEEVATDPDGRFEVPDAAARAPLLVVKPSGHPDLAAMAFEPAEGEGEYALARASYLELDVPSSVSGVFLVLPKGRAVRIKDDPAVSMRPLPVVVPAGRRDLLVLLRSGKWSAPIVDLPPGQTRPLSPDFR